MWASERAKRSVILRKAGPVLGEITPTASFISPGVGFENQTHLWSSHQNSEEKNKVALLFCFASSALWKDSRGGELPAAARRPSDQLSGPRGPGGR